MTFLADLKPMYFMDTLRVFFCKKKHFNECYCYLLTHEKLKDSPNTLNRAFLTKHVHISEFCRDCSQWLPVYNDLFFFSPKLFLMFLCCCFFLYQVHKEQCCGIRTDLILLTTPAQLPEGKTKALCRPLCEEDGSKCRVHTPGRNK